MSLALVKMAFLLARKLAISAALDSTMLAVGEDLVLDMLELRSTRQLEIIPHLYQPFIIEHEKARPRAYALAIHADP